MKSNGKTIVSDDPIVKKPNGKDDVSSTVLDQPTGKNDVFSAKVHKVMPVVSSAVPIQPSGKTAVSSVKVDKVHSSAKVDKVLFFRDVSFGIQEGEVRFRLIHFWEARNVLTKTLIGLEMLLIDEQGTVIQGFIPPARIDTYLPHMKAGSVYRLNKCFGSNSKVMYRVAEPGVVSSFTSNSVLSDLEDSQVNFHDDRFRFHSYEEFEAACDLKDYVGHLKLVNGQTLNDNVVLDEEEIASTRRLLLHGQTHDGPVMKLYLWDQAAADFCAKFKSHGSTPRVILVTTVNPKRFGGAFALASMSSSRVFLDFDVQPTRDYVTWLESNLDVANRVDAKVVTKTETMTIGELFSYIKQEATKVAWFECTTTVDDLFHGSPWYYIGCDVCHTKATKGPTSLMCKKCGKHEVDGVPQYLTKLSVYDNNDQAVFVILGEAGHVIPLNLCELSHITASNQNLSVLPLFQVRSSAKVDKGTVIQSFIPSARIDTYLPHMKARSVYILNKCFGSNNKVMYRVAEPRVIISFTLNSVLSDLEDSRVNFPDDRFRFHSYEEFEAACDLKGDLYDYVGHLKLVNGQTLNDNVVLDEEEIASNRRLLLHVQTHDGPVMKLYLWDQTAADFCAKFKSHGSTPRVILVTTVNPKRFGGVLALASMSSSRVFLDFDVQPTRDYCTSTVDAVFHGSPWYYIGCGVCHTKAIKGPTSLMCKKCGKHEVDGVPQYLTKLSVYDNNDQAVLLSLANESMGDDHLIPVPQTLVDTIGRTYRFIVKVSDHNLKGQIHTLTVTKVLPLDAPEPVEALVETVSGEPVDGRVKRGSDLVESGEAKRSKSGN
ncbi:hypothetical protein F2Q70_00013135 [Brassica cretica]|uniref:Replication factor A C-terminal domain-containing protein n=1 Tax=Brassica cretica TaxID=69181 RepID=A0A8S9M5B9_BRACR|nr:hypothetical protein F2Q70_00013135 [Brassica cretica]